MVFGVLIALHAAAGLLAAGTGLRAIRDGARFDLYLASLVACIGFVAVAVAVDWSGLDDASRVLFAALLGLGCYMIFRGARARRRLLAAPRVRSTAYVDDVGFTLIALFDAFIVIAVLDIGASGYLAAAVAIAGAVLGHHTLERYKRRTASGRRSGLGLGPNPTRQISG